MMALKRLYAANLKRLSERMKEISKKLEQGEEYEGMWRDLNWVEAKVDYCIYLSDVVKDEAEEEAERD